MPMEIQSASPSAPEQLAFLLEKRSGLSTDLQAEIGALQVKVQHLYTHAVQQLGKEGNVVKAGDGDERERGGKQQQQQPTQVAATPLLPAQMKPRSRLTALRPPATRVVASVAVVVAAAAKVEVEKARAQVEGRRRRTMGTRKKKRMLRQSSGCKTRSCALSFPTSTPRR